MARATMNVERIRREPVNFLTLPAEATIGLFLIEVILSSIWICYGAFILENVDLNILTLQQGLLSFMAFVAAWKISRGWTAFMCIYEVRFCKDGLYYYFNKSNKYHCPPDLQFAIIIGGSTFLVLCASASQYAENPYAEFLIYGLGAGTFAGTVSTHFKFYVQKLHVGYPDSMHHFLENLGRSTGLIVMANFIPYLLAHSPIAHGRTMLSGLVVAAVYPIASVIHRRGMQRLKRENEENDAYFLRNRSTNEQASPSTSAVQSNQPITSQPTASQSQPSTSFQPIITSRPSLHPQTETQSAAGSEESTDRDRPSFLKIFTSLWRFEVLFRAVITASTVGLTLVILATIPYLECKVLGQKSKKQSVHNLNYIAFVWVIVVCCMYLTDRFKKRSSIHDFIAGILLVGTSLVAYSYKELLALSFAMFGGGLGLLAYHEDYFYWLTIRQKKQFETIKAQVEAVTGILMLMACVPVYYSGWTAHEVLNYIGYFYYAMAGVIFGWVYFPYVRSRIVLFYMWLRERRTRQSEFEMNEMHGPEAQPPAESG